MREKIGGRRGTTGRRLHDWARERASALRRCLGECGRERVTIGHMGKRVKDMGPMVTTIVGRILIGIQSVALPQPTRGTTAEGHYHKVGAAQPHSPEQQDLATN